MYRVFAAVVTVSVAAFALAQTVDDLKTQTDRTPTVIPEIPAGEDPMAREPDPAADTPAAKALPQPAGAGNGGAECRVRRADTDTGFVVVCEERDDG